MLIVTQDIPCGGGEGVIDGGKRNPSDDFIKLICSLYGDTYDDREEDSRPGGEDWEPGVKAAHLSLGTFQKELNRNEHGKTP